MCVFGKQFDEEHYFLKGVLGNNHIPTAPILYFNLFVNKSAVSGNVLLSNPSYEEEIIVTKVEGIIHKTSHVDLIQIATLTEITEVIKNYSEHHKSTNYLEAVFSIEKNGTGIGSFTYKHHSTEDVPLLLHKREITHQNTDKRKEEMNEFKFGYFSKHGYDS